MALLDMYFKKGCYVEVAHVNYHKRDTANRDEKIVEDYCKKNNIVLHKLDFDQNNVKGNFQAQARKVRYSWFAEICNVFNLNVVLVAHHEDDYIETYLMQKAKNLGVDTYGLADHNEIYGANVYRPLLDTPKQELINYCKRRKIEYGIDESNLTDTYTRNKIRHSKVEKMSFEERKEIVNEAIIKNIELLQKRTAALRFIYSKNSFDYDEFINYEYLTYAIKEYFDVPMSDKYLNEIVRQLKNNDSYKLLKKGKYLVKEYGKVNLFRKPEEYSFKVEYNELFYTDYFKIQRTGKDSLSCVKVSEDDYPLTIRNVKQGDSIKMRYGTKKINRFFIDNKISLKQRLTWPIVLNRHGDAILVPGIGCSVNHYGLKPNLYVIKL